MQEPGSHKVLKMSECSDGFTRQLLTVCPARWRDGQAPLPKGPPHRHTVNSLSKQNVMFDNFEVGKRLWSMGPAWRHTLVRERLCSSGGWKTASSLFYVLHFSPNFILQWREV